MRTNKNTFVEMARVVLNRVSFYMYHRHEFDFFDGEETCCQYEIHITATRETLVFQDYQEAQDKFASLVQEAFPKFLETPVHMMGLREE